MEVDEEGDFKGVTNQVKGNTVEETTISRTVEKEGKEPTPLPPRPIITEVDLRANPVRRPPIQGKIKMIEDLPINIERVTNKKRQRMATPIRELAAAKWVLIKLLKRRRRKRKRRRRRNQNQNGRRWRCTPIKRRTHLLDQDKFASRHSPPN